LTDRSTLKGLLTGSSDGMTEVDMIKALIAQAKKQQKRSETRISEDQLRARRDTHQRIGTRVEEVRKNAERIEVLMTAALVRTQIDQLRQHADEAERLRGLADAGEDIGDAQQQLSSDMDQTVAEYNDQWNSVLRKLGVIPTADGDAEAAEKFTHLSRAHKRRF